MATQKDVEKSLEYRMSEYTTAYPIPTDYPTTTYTSVIGTSYLKLDYLHTATSAVELGTASADRATGIYQITLNVENNVGSAESTKLITQLKEYFKRGTVASHNDVNVRILSFYLGSSSSDGDWFRTVVNVVFRSDISN